MTDLSDSDVPHPNPTPLPKRDVIDIDSFNVPDPGTAHYVYTTEGPGCTTSASMKKRASGAMIMVNVPHDKASRTQANVQAARHLGVYKVKASRLDPYAKLSEKRKLLKQEHQLHDVPVVEFEKTSLTPM